MFGRKIGWERNTDQYSLLCFSTTALTFWLLWKEKVLHTYNRLTPWALESASLNKDLEKMQTDSRLTADSPSFNPKPLSKQDGISQPPPPLFSNRWTFQCHKLMNFIPITLQTRLSLPSLPPPLHKLTCHQLAAVYIRGSYYFLVASVTLTCLECFFSERSASKQSRPEAHFYHYFWHKCKLYSIPRERSYYILAFQF